MADAVSCGWRKGNENIHSQPGTTVKLPADGFQHTGLTLSLSSSVLPGLGITAHLSVVRLANHAAWAWLMISSSADKTPG